MKFERTFDGTKTFVAAHYTTLEVIDGNEGAKIVGNELIEQDKIELRVQEGAILKIGLDVKNLEVRSVSGGIIETKGKELISKDTKVKIRAAGEADINASESVDARITAGGDIYIYGNPKNVKKKQTFGGRIEIKN